MNPLEAQIKVLEERVRQLEQATNTAFVAELQRRLTAGQVSVDTGTSSGTTIAVRNAADSGSETVAAEYTGALNLYNNGVLLGKIGYY